MWTLSEERRLLLEAHVYLRITGPTGIAPRSKLPLTATGAKEMTAHEWVNFAKVSGPLLLHNAYPKDASTAAAACRLLRVIRMGLVSCVAPGHTAAMQAVIDEVKENFNHDFPAIMKSMMLHLLLFHVPAAVARWGPARGFWCFPFERLVANRDNCQDKSVLL